MAASRPIRILFICHRAAFYGDNRSLLPVVERLGPDWVPSFVVPDSGEFADELRRRGYAIHRIEMRAGGHLLKGVIAAARLALLILARHIDLVHVNTHFRAAVTIAACRFTGVPMVVHVRNMISRIRPPRLLRPGVVEAVICISEAVRRSLSDAWGPGQPFGARAVVVIPDGRDLDPFGRGEGGRIRAELGLEADAPLVGTVARINPMRGHEIFLQMAARVAERVPSARFLIVGGPVAEGDDAYLRSLERLRTQLGLEDRVTLTGYREDVPDILAALDAFVLPTRQGAFVSVLIEAMASGVPIVVTDVDGVPECVGRDGAGLLIPGLDPDEFAAATVRVLTDRELATRLGGAARRRARTRFGITSLARDTEEVWRRAAARGAAERASEAAEKSIPGRRGGPRA